jgi:hypothetical protein
MTDGGLGGTVNTPLGSVKKEYLLVGGAVFALLFIVFYRQKKAQQAAATAAAGANIGIDPATGYAYGSPEDAAALANQGAYINPAQPYAPGGSGAGYPAAGSGPGSFVNNSQWAQYAEQYMQSNGQVSDVGPLSAAIGKYLAGQATTPDEHSLVNQAIAIAGYPPVAGPNGMPPGFNTTPVGNTPPPSGKLPAVTGLYGGSGMFNVVNGKLQNNYIDVGWNAVEGAAGYRYEEKSAFGGQSFDLPASQTRMHETVSRPNADHYITVWAVDSAGKRGDPATVVVHTHDNSF